MAIWRWLVAHPITSLLLCGAVLVLVFLVWSGLLHYEVLYAVTPRYKADAGYDFCRHLSVDFSTLQVTNNCAAWSLLTGAIMVAVLASAVGPSEDMASAWPKWIQNQRGVILTAAALCLALFSHLFFSRADAASIGAEESQLRLDGAQSGGDRDAFFRCIDVRAKWESAKRDANAYARKLAQAQIEHTREAATTKAQVLAAEKIQAEADRVLTTPTLNEKAEGARQEAASFSEGTTAEKLLALQSSLVQATEAAALADQKATAAESTQTAARDAAKVATDKQTPGNEEVKIQAQTANDQAVAARVAANDAKANASAAQALAVTAARDPTAANFESVKVKILGASKRAEDAQKSAQGAAQASKKAVQVVAPAAK
jgi:hypothetical protein